jgi:hypothetical protein
VINDDRLLCTPVLKMWRIVWWCLMMEYDWILNMIILLWCMMMEYWIWLLVDDVWWFKAISKSTSQSNKSATLANVIESKINFTRVARWYIFTSKILLWVYFGEPWNIYLWEFMVIWNILRPFGIFYDHLVNVVAIWFMFSRCGMFWQSWNIYQ